MNSELKNKKDKLVGKIVESAGDIMDDEELKFKGRIQSMKAQMGEKAEDMKEKMYEKANHVVDKVKDVGKHK